MLVTKTHTISYHETTTTKFNQKYTKNTKWLHKSRNRPNRVIFPISLLLSKCLWAMQYYEWFRRFTRRRWKRGNAPRRRKSVNSLPSQRSEAAPGLNHRQKARRQVYRNPVNWDQRPQPARKPLPPASSARARRNRRSGYIRPGAWLHCSICRFRRRPQRK